MKTLGAAKITPKKIAAQLQKGGVVVYPTETCYGLGADATNQKAVDKIFAIKKRQKDKPLLIVVPDPEMIKHYIAWTPELEKIAHKYWPGPLTVVVPVHQKDGLASGVIAQDGTLAFRITSHPMAAAISTELNAPLVSTSANISAHKSPYSIEEVQAMFKDQDEQPDTIIDAGELPDALPSTVIRLDDGHITTLRQGQMIIDAL